MKNSIEEEIAQLRGLDLRGLQARWKITFRKPALPHLPKHLLFGILAYRLQADAFGDLDAATKAALEQSGGAKSRGVVASQLDDHDQRQAKPEAGTVLMREWKGREHRVMAMADGFAWNGKTYRSLSAVALAMTGTRWNGPRFFGLRDGTIDKKSRTDR
ncbi:putative bacteriophage-related protein [Bradyrhizobiaceae bacterium SG-6C]|nr:putative bacteriophage-related protein [Bradyrhizobiaceae bacterium SG-6C]